MCGRFASALKPSDAWLELMQEWSDALFNRYNVSPASQIGAFVEGRCHAMRWGLVPSWAKNLSGASRLINARAETVATKPSFRAAFKRRRCLILADGFYEWQKSPGTTKKQPFLIHRADARPFLLAGLHETWMDEHGKDQVWPVIEAMAR